MPPALRVAQVSADRPGGPVHCGHAVGDARFGGLGSIAGRNVAGVANRSAK
jgi:hypothetical protein